MSFGIIYKATNLENGKVYIGQTIKSLETRKNVHYSKYSSCVYFHNALMKYPKDSWTWEVIEQCDSREELDKKEIYWIAFYNSKNSAFGYNLTDGGQGSRGVIITDEHKRKTRESMLLAVTNNYSKANSQLKPVKCVELNQNFCSFSDAARKTNSNVNSIRRVIKGELNTAGGYHWKLLEGEERIKCLPNAIYCVELDKIYDTIRQARVEDRFHEGNLSIAMKNGSSDEPKSYAGYTFYWVNPEYHV